MLAIYVNHRSALRCCVRAWSLNNLMIAFAVPTMMYGYGDTRNHYQATVDLVEVCINAEDGICKDMMIL